MAKKSDNKEPKPKYFSFSVISSIVLLILVFVFFEEYNLFTTTEKMFFYFFSASSQSMAAMFAVVGVFAVFRFQTQENKLRNLYDLFKNWVRQEQDALARFTGREIDNGEWVIRSGNVNVVERDRNPLFWKDSQVLEMGKGMLKLVHPNLAKNWEVKDLRDKLEEIEIQEEIRNRILKSMKIPMLAILIVSSQ